MFNFFFQKIDLFNEVFYQKRVTTIGISNLIDNLLKTNDNKKKFWKKLNGYKFGRHIWIEYLEDSKLSLSQALIRN